VFLGREDERGVVHVLSAARARPRRFLVTFILGLVDGEFPLVDQRIGLLSAGERREANRRAGAPLFSEPHDEEEALFAVGVSRPWQMLYLSSRDWEDDGGEAVPSPFYRQAQALLPSAPVWAGRDLRAVAHPAGSAPSHREYLRACVVQGLRPTADSDEALLQGISSWVRAPRLVTTPVRDELRGLPSFTARELEAYARCPFAWFLRNVVRLDVIDQRWDALQMGSLAHDALAAAYRALAAEGRLPLTEAELPRAFALVREQLRARLEAPEAPGEKGDRRLAGAVLARDLEAFLAFDASTGSRLPPAAFELSVGGREGIDIGGLRVRGRIDRLDGGVAGLPLFVVDYKTGQASHGSDFDRRGDLQVPLYLLALRALRPQADLAGGVYASLGGRTQRGMVLAEHGPLVGSWRAKNEVERDFFEAQLESCRASAVQAAEGIRSGVIDADAPSGCPRYCDLAAICRRGRPMGWN